MLLFCCLLFCGCVVAVFLLLWSCCFGVLKLRGFVLLFGVLLFCVGCFVVVLCCCFAVVLFWGFVVWGVVVVWLCGSIVVFFVRGVVLCGFVVLLFWGFADLGSIFVVLLSLVVLWSCSFWGLLLCVFVFVETVKESYGSRIPLLLLQFEFVCPSFLRC